MNHRVDIREDIKRYQDTLSYASSKVDFSVGESIYMISSDMTLKIKTGTVGYNNKILVSDEKFILGKNEKVNSVETAAMKSHKHSNVVTQTVVTHKDSEKTAVTHKDLIKHQLSFSHSRIIPELTISSENFYFRHSHIFILYFNREIKF